MKTHSLPVSALLHKQVSQMSSEQLAFVALLVQGNTLKISERRSVAIAAEENATFVQTDTPVHKPGDIGKLL